MHAPRPAPDPSGLRSLWPVTRNGSGNAAALRARQSRNWLAGIAALLVLIMWSMIAFEIADEYDDLEQNARQSLARSASATGEQINQIIGQLDRAALLSAHEITAHADRDVAAEVAANGPGPMLPTRTEIRRGDGKLLLETGPSCLRTARAVPPPAPRTITLESPGGAACDSLAIARRLASGADGELIVDVRVDARALGDLLRRFLMEEDSRIDIADLDGNTLLAYSGLPDRPSAVILKGTQALADHGLVVTVSRAWSSILRPYLANFIGKALFGLVITVLVAVIIARVLRQMRRDALAEQSRLVVEDRFRVGIDAMSEGLILADIGGAIVTWNKAFERLFPQLEGSLRVGLPMSALLEQWLAAGRSRDTAQERLAAYGSGLECLDVMEAPRRSLVSAARPTADGGMIVTVRDATAELAARQLQQERERAVRDFAEIASDWLWETDAQGRYIMISASAARHGVDPEAMIGTSREEALAKCSLEPEQLAVHKAEIATHCTFRGLRGQRTLPNGRIAHFTESGKPLFDEHGVFTGYRGTVTEITRLVEAEEELRRAKTQAESASRAKSQFLANMSHEIRTPLSGVISLLDMLIDEGLSAPQLNKAEMARRSADQLMETIGDILDMSKLEAGAIKLERVPVDLAVLVDDAVQTVAAPAFTKGLQIRKEVGGAAWFLTDPTRLRQVLINLLSNAVKFTAAGCVTIAMTREAEVAGERIVFKVSDTGIGITRDQLPLLFKKFSQADQSISRRFGGTGLGLAIIQELVTLMGGTIEVASEPGRGTTFRVVLSLVAASPPATAEAAAVPAAANAEPLAGLRILLVEDDPTNRFAAVQLLRRCGATVDAAEDGEAGVAAALRQGYDLILMDMQMPRLDGPSATRQLRANHGPNRTTPIVALTANAFTDDIELCLAAGMNAHLTKPLRRRTVENELLRLLKVASAAA